MSALVKEVYSRLFEAYGPQGWWPYRGEYQTENYLPQREEAFNEIILGAVLTQNTAWTNVEKALANLRGEGEISLEKITLFPREKLAELIRPSGYFNQKAIRLKDLTSWLLAEGFTYNSDKIPQRTELLARCGIGPETADSMLLYAWGQTEFVVDAYTRRIFFRLGLCGEKESYESLKNLISQELSPDVVQYNEYHALIVNLCKECCQKRNPLCKNCPLHSICHFG